jgi:hypothetical protein
LLPFYDILNLHFMMLYPFWIETILAHIGPCMGLSPTIYLTFNPYK